MDTSVFPYTADTLGYSCLSGNPEKNSMKLRKLKVEFFHTPKCNSKELVIPLKC